LLSPVNPKTEAENAISSRSVLYFGSTMTRTALAFCSQGRAASSRKNAPTKRSINQLTSGDGTFREFSLTFSTSAYELEADLMCTTFHNFRSTNIHWWRKADIGCPADVS